MVIWSLWRCSTFDKVVRTSAIHLQYNYNNITQKFCCIAAVRTSAIQLQYKKKFFYCSCIVVVLYLCGPLNATLIRRLMTFYSIECIVLGWFSSSYLQHRLQHDRCRDSNFTPPVEFHKEQSKGKMQDTVAWAMQRGSVLTAPLNSPIAYSVIRIC